MTDKILSKSILPLLSALVATTPLAIDLYLPAFVAISAYFDTNMANVQLSLSSYLAGYAIGMMLFGPLIDQKGRRLFALFGLLGFALCSFLLTVTKSIDTFIALRFAQAFFGSAVTVVVPGIIRHMYQENTAKGMSYVSMIMMLAPLLAPSIGSVLMITWHWHAIFYALTLYALVLFTLAYFFLQEVPIHPSKLRGAALFLSNYRIVLTNHKARFDIVISMLASFAFFCFLTKVSAIYMEHFKVSESEFGVLFAFNVLALMLGNFINTRLVPRFGSRKMLNLGLMVSFVSVTCLIFVSTFTENVYLVAAFIAPLMMSLGIMVTNADALILINFKKKSGTATAVIGTLRFGSGALAGPILAFIPLPPSTGFAVAMAIAVSGILICQLKQLKYGH
ncbi:multidrug effflux MFS transporter [Pseudoalteromonas sp. SSM20]|uniref:multidrug effflux MFS transporter n=1 Tax=Pseudoalteromonas sp. SSM20 TaxID=3139394 RepID=UPI003BA8DD8C